MIELKNITKKFNGICAVNGVSLKIKKRECAVILGHSGCGKTTLLRVVAGLEKPDSGEIYLNGELANNPNILIPARNRKVAFVFQDLALWPHMTVAQNLSFGLENIYKDKRRLKEEVDNIIEKVHLSSKKNVYPSKLSGGEQQRVALARALVRRPEILLMDEPFSNLDSALKEYLIELIKELHSRFNITLVYVTHDHVAAGQLSRRTVFMNAGKIDSLQQAEG